MASVPSSSTCSPPTPASLTDELYLPGTRQISRVSSNVGASAGTTSSSNSNNPAAAPLNWTNNANDSVAPSSVNELERSAVRLQVAGLFDVPGLGYPLVQEAIDGYFATAGRLNPSLDEHDFRRRFQAHFASILGTFSGEDAEDISPLLILAVAAVGIAHTSQPRRFDLQRQMVLRSEAMARKGMVSHGLDGIAAVIVLDDILTGVEGSPLFWKRSEDPLYIHPLSHEGLLRLANHFGLHRSAMSLRESRIFWHIYVLNSWRHESPTYLHPREIDNERPARGTLLDPWHDSLLALSVINREVNETCWTSSYRKYGIAPAQIIELLRRLREYELRHVSKPQPSSLPTDFICTDARQSLVHILYFNTVMSLEAYARSAGLEADSTDISEVRSMLRTAATRAFRDIVHLTDEAAHQGYFTWQSKPFRALTTGCVIWCIERIERASEHGRADVATWLVDCAERMIGAIDSTTACYVDSALLAADLRGRLSRANTPAPTQTTWPGVIPLEEACTTELWSWLLDPAFYCE